jgi:hypothetical protein
VFRAVEGTVELVRADITAVAAECLYCYSVKKFLESTFETI